MLIKKYNRRILFSLSLILPNSVTSFLLAAGKLGCLLRCMFLLRNKGLDSFVISGYTVVFLGSSCLIVP